MEYRIDKTFTEFMREIAKEELKIDCAELICSEEEIEIKAGNNRKILTKYIRQLGMETLFYDSRYIINKKKTKVFPVHFQVLSRVLLNQKRKAKKDFGKKILDNKFSEITKD